jgi:hypothetical protein
MGSGRNRGRGHTLTRCTPQRKDTTRARKARTGRESARSRGGGYEQSKKSEARAKEEGRE